MDPFNLDLDLDLDPNLLEKGEKRESELTDELITSTIGIIESAKKTTQTTIESKITNCLIPQADQTVIDELIDLRRLGRKAVNKLKEQEKEITNFINQRAKTRADLKGILNGQDKEITNFINQLKPPLQPCLKKKSNVKNGVRKQKK
eukprot:Pgem_evm1s9831